MDRLFPNEAPVLYLIRSEDDLLRLVADVPQSQIDLVDWYVRKRVASKHEGIALRPATVNSQ